MRKYQLAIVSNRLPVNITRVGGKLVFNASSGGLATAMSSLPTEGRIWVGWPGIAADELTEAEKEEIALELAKHGCYPVHLTKSQIKLFYEGYANDTLWPLFHYFQSLAQHDDAYWAAYQEVNQLYAAAIAECVEPYGSIWIHDYHLMMAPAMVRSLVPYASIGFFLHIPFPSFELYRALPQRKEILEGLLGADLIGFHIYDYARHFLSSCLRLLGLSSHQGLIDYDGRTIKTDAYPIGIDYAKFRQALTQSDTKRAIKSLKEHYTSQKLIISVDRLDYTKGIPERLEAFRLLLEENPEYHGRVSLLMIAVPSRTEVKTYQQLRAQIEQTVSRINGTYGTVDWAPISYQFQNLPFEEVVALYAMADIALVTPTRDGMNLVAKEYIASKQKMPGVLVLSEMAGAIDELPEALAVNPNDTHSITTAIRQALRMSKREQSRRLGIMQRRLKSYTVQTWAHEFIADLESAGGKREARHKKRLTETQRLGLLAGYSDSRSRLIILDYDGTLKDFVSSPSALAAKPALRLRRIIKRLSQDPSNTVAIVSGRPRKTMDRWFKGLDIVLAAEHGAWTRYDGKWTHTDSDFKDIKQKIKPLLEKYVSRTAGAEVEEKDYALVWHYRNVPPELAYVRATEIKRELIGMIDRDDIGVYSGEKIIEIKPVEVNKGYVAAELEAIYQSDFILCAGDDYTDEDMFRELSPEANTIKVGPGSTKAKFQMLGVSSMIDLLDELSRLK
ncbi:hypothetical protein RAAC3_TM7C00001G0736 [Candidatus Saccharibacteria bacterium RAAC3_TM7_1]|nr:hypothetical protein RAAC3_TM7C00001G0736 [Candidatus Saccharibacteria bacterium RAAC3_TM7_1]HCZ28556.1 bifunctional alpha,alpha-trehalose-phosphate synthase (UDP-forming)/trehalose-phosphatase [Candidatus Saccharibacteria bacterium]